MKKLLLTGTIVLLTATSALACDCCIVQDPIGTPLNVRDEPNGSILFTIPNRGVVGGPDKLKKDSKGHVWAFIEYPLSDAREREGWVFLRYLDCEADAIKELLKEMDRTTAK